MLNRLAKQRESFPVGYRCGPRRFITLRGQTIRNEAVSYTHLTLPTIYSV